MFEIKVVSNFCAAHYLENYKGKCESLHGHNWRIEAVVFSKTLDSRDMVIDFNDLKKALGDVIYKFDHRLLNDMPFFKKKNTTSEVIAQYIFIELKKKLTVLSKSRSIKHIKLKEIAVWEKENSCALYREETKR